MDPKKRFPKKPTPRPAHRNEELDHKVSPRVVDDFEFYNDAPVVHRGNLVECEELAASRGFELVIDSWLFPTQVFLWSFIDRNECYLFRTRNAHWNLYHVAREWVEGAGWGVPEFPDEDVTVVAGVDPALSVQVAAGMWDGGLRTFSDLLAVLDNNRLP